MKQKLQGIIIGLLIGVLLTGSVAIAASTTTLYDVKVGGIKIVVDGKTLNPKDANGKRVEPMIYNGTTYLPVRAVGEAIGKSVYWDGPNYTVYLGKMNGNLEYPTVLLKDLKNISGSGSGNGIEMNSEDNYGNRYNNALDFGSYRSYEYLTNMKYSYLKGVFYVESGISTDNELGSLVVEADGRQIYVSPVMTKTSAPIPIKVNITGYNDIKIYTTSINSYGYALQLGDAGFYQ